MKGRIDPGVDAAQRALHPRADVECVGPVYSGWMPVGLRWIALPASTAAILVTVIGVATTLPGQSAGVIVAAAVALTVGAGATAFTTLIGSDTLAIDLAALVAVGLAGVVLAGLLPDTPGFVLVYLALAGIAMRAPPAPAIVVGLVILGVLDLAYLLSGKIPVNGLSVSGLVSQDIGAAFVFAVGAFTRSARIARDEATLARARAEDLLGQLQASQAAQAEAVALTERTRLAREIHDILAHALSGLVLSLDAMELLARPGADAGPATMERMREQISRAQRIARDGLADTRRAVSALRGDELPGPALLDRLVRDAAAATGVRATLSVTGPERPLPPEVGLALYRTAQEALTNTAKYAGQGGTAELRMEYGDDGVELVIEDSRRAAPAPPAAGLTFGGYGLTGMRERAELLGGSLTAGPTEAGFCVRLWLPARTGPVVPAEAGTGGPDGSGLDDREAVAEGYAGNGPGS
jgi:signal transduction histidine kinase